MRPAVGQRRLIPPSVEGTLPRSVFVLRHRSVAAPVATVATHRLHGAGWIASDAGGGPPLPGRRVAVGTTSVRTIEDFLARHAAPLPHPCLAEAGIYILPPREFRGVDALITNFHQPRSTLLCLVSAFLTPGSTAGVDWLREIYQEAIGREYRFFSYGDAMLIL